VGQQTNLPEELIAPRRCWEKPKVESRGGATSQSPKVGQVVDPGADLVGQRAAFKTEFPHLA
jgi:hypothetical protein